MTIDPATFYRTASTALSRLACRYADPTGQQYDHDHVTECLTDEHAITADLLLRFTAAVASQDESAMLDALAVLNDTVVAE